MIELLYTDEYIIVAKKPSGVLSTDEPGGMPSLVRKALDNPEAEIRTVHRLDQVVSGLMLLARDKNTASELGKQIMSHEFEKEYLAIVHGGPEESNGTFTDLLLRNKQERKTYPVNIPQKGAQEAILHYKILCKLNEMALVQIVLETGRTHQIRAQFSSRGWPLVGDRKYGKPEEESDIALFSYKLSFIHPYTKEKMLFTLLPDKQYPWDLFSEKLSALRV